MGSERIELPTYPYSKSVKKNCASSFSGFTSIWFAKAVPERLQNGGSSNIQKTLNKKSLP